MTKYISGLIAVLVAMSVGPVANADIFFSGTIDMNNANGPAGSNSIQNAKRIDLAAGGASFNNNFLNSGAPASASVGNTLTTVGFIPLSSAASGNITSSFNAPNTSLIAVYAGVGTASAVGGQLQGNFEPGDAGNAFGANRLVVSIFDRSAVAAAGLDGTNPATWVNDINDLSNGLLATMETTNRADTAPFYALGQPGAPTTALPVIVDPTLVNTIGIRIDEATAGFDGDFKLAITDLGDFFADFFVDPGDPSLVQQGGPDVLFNLDQQLSLTENQTPDVDGLNTLFAALLGGGFFADDGTFSLGSGFTVPADVLAALASGDAVVNNDGGQGFPGAQFDIEREPEPTTVLIWGVVGLIGYAASRKVKPAAAC